MLPSGDTLVLGHKFKIGNKKLLKCLIALKINKVYAHIFVFSDEYSTAKILEFLLTNFRIFPFPSFIFQIFFSDSNVSCL